MLGTTAIDVGTAPFPCHHFRLTRMLLSALLILTIAWSVHAHKSNYDVCVIGGGAGGVSTAIFSKDAGLDVVIIEKEPLLGGHCDTKYFSAPPGARNWVDLGVVVFPDTIEANMILDGNPYGRWEDFDMKSFMKRFAGNDSIIPTYTSGKDTYLFFDNIGAFINTTGTAPPPSPDFNTAVANYLSIFVKYPWIETGITPPQGPIPDELLVPFNTFIASRNLSALVPMFYGNAYIGGMGSWDSLSTLWALRQLSPTDMLSFTVPDSHYSLQNGCQSFYDGALAYLGASNVLLQSNVTHVTRPSNQGNVYVNVANTSDSDNGTLVLNCSKLVVAIEQTLNNLEFMDLDAQETAVFSSVSVRSYFDGTVDLQGPIENNSTYTLMNLDYSNPDYSLAKGPTWAAIAKFGADPGFPRSIYAFADSYMSEADMTPILNKQLTQMTTLPGTIVTGVDSLDIHRHDYYPYPSNDACKNTTNFFQSAALLQGYRNTYWAGALLAMDSHVSIFFHTRKLVCDYFINQVATTASIHNNGTSDTSSGPLVFILGGVGLIGMVALVLAGVYGYRKVKKTAPLPMAMCSADQNEKEIELMAVSEVPC